MNKLIFYKSCKKKNHLVAPSLVFWIATQSASNNLHFFTLDTEGISTIISLKNSVIAKSTFNDS